MFFDNLTIAGLVVATVTALLPLFFGRELIRVQTDVTNTPAPPPRESDASETVLSEIDCATAAEACD